MNSSKARASWRVSAIQIWWSACLALGCTTFQTLSTLPVYPAALLRVFPTLASLPEAQSSPEAMVSPL